MNLRRLGRLLLASAIAATPLVVSRSSVEAAVPQWSVVDDAVEAKLIALGLDDVLDDYVAKANVANLTSLDLSGSAVEYLNGLESSRLFRL
jgi:hypothetical protein